jgi:hypothetical protein
MLVITHNTHQPPHTTQHHTRASNHPPTQHNGRRHLILIARRVNPLHVSCFTLRRVVLLRRRVVSSPLGCRVFPIALSSLAPSHGMALFPVLCACSTLLRVSVSAPYPPHPLPRKEETIVPLDEVDPKPKPTHHTSHMTHRAARICGVCFRPDGTVRPDLRKRGAVDGDWGTLQVARCGSCVIAGQRGVVHRRLKV